MKKNFALLVMSFLLAVPAIAGWEMKVNCKDSHGNQLVIDESTENHSERQLVLRPQSDYRNVGTSVTANLIHRGFAYSNPDSNETQIVVGGGQVSGNLDFFLSDQYLTHRVSVSNQGAHLKVSKSGEAFAEWDFPYCVSH